MKRRNPASGGSSGPHKEDHQKDGPDEINVTDLSGKLADAQNAGEILGKTVDDAALSKNDTLKYDGTKWVMVPYNTNFTFSIASFSDAQSSTVEIGSGEWKAAGAVSFTASYNNGPATGGYVSMANFGNSWAANLDMGAGTSFQGPTVSTEAVNYPSTPKTASWTLHATDGEDSPTNNESVNFWNYVRWGLSTKASGYTEADIEGLSGNALSNSRVRSFTVTAGASDYIMWASPVRLGAVTFKSGGFTGGFQSPETVSVTTAAGFVEDFYIYRSDNSGLGETTVETS